MRQDRARSLSVGRSLNQPSTASVVDLVHLPFIPRPLSPPRHLATSPTTELKQTRCPSPLLRDVGPSSSGSMEDTRRGSSTQRGDPWRPRRCVISTSHDFCRGLFLPFPPPLSPLTTLSHTHGNANSCEGAKQPHGGSIGDSASTSTIRQAIDDPTGQSTAQQAIDGHSRHDMEGIDHTAHQSTTQRANRPHDTPANRPFSRQSRMWRENRPYDGANRHPAGQLTIRWANPRPIKDAAGQSTKQHANRQNGGLIDEMVGQPTRRWASRRRSGLIEEV